MDITILGFEVRNDVGQGGMRWITVSTNYTHQHRVNRRHKGDILS
jgi:hypothetical protein